MGFVPKKYFLAVLILSLLQFITVKGAPSQPEYDISEEPDLPQCEVKDELIPHIHCFLYYKCVDSRPKLKICRHSLYFNTETGKCEDKSKVSDCVEGVRILPGSSFPSSLKNMFKVVQEPEDESEEGLLEEISGKEELEEETPVALATLTYHSPDMPVTYTPPRKDPPKKKEFSTTTTEMPTLMPTFMPQKYTTEKFQSSSAPTASPFSPPGSGMNNFKKVAQTIFPDKKSLEPLHNGMCQPTKIMIHHFPGPCKAEFTCRDGTFFFIENCSSFLLWKPNFVK